MNPKRLRAELEYLARHSTEGIEASPNEANTTIWNARIKGPPETVYEGYTVRIQMNFPSDYPMHPPRVKIMNSVYHPNINGESICVDFLGSKWTPIYNVQKTLLCIQSLLTDPGLASPLNGEAARDWPNKKAFLEKVRIKMIKE